MWGSSMEMLTAGLLGPARPLIAEKISFAKMQKREEKLCPRVHRSIDESRHHVDALKNSA
jgi:hypothetical protein